MPFSQFDARSDYATLPTVSFVIPNLDNDMHDGTIEQADAWLSTNLTRYANWALANNSLLVVTWDEDDDGADNQIPTIICGAHVRPGAYPETISHYNLLSTVRADVRTAQGGACRRRSRDLDDLGLTGRSHFRWVPLGAGLFALGLPMRR